MRIHSSQLSRCLSLCAAISVLVVASAAARADTLKVGGTGGALAGMDRLAQEFKRLNPGHDVAMVPNLGSGGGIKAMLSGAIGVALSSRPLKSSEERAGVTSIAYAKTPIAFAVKKDYVVRELSLAQLGAIYQGKTTTWPGTNKNIRIILRPDNEFDTQVVKGMSPEIGSGISALLAKDGMIIAMTDQLNADAIERTPDSIGFLSTAQLVGEGRPLDALSIDGVSPMSSGTANKAYRWQKTFYLIYDEKGSPHAKDFARFVMSPAGQDILQSLGHLSPNE